MEKKFIEQVAPFAINTWKTHKILPSLTIAQAILESGWGKSELATKANNYFGIKASNWNGATYEIKTKEFRKGKWAVETAVFRKYKNMEESVDDKGEFLQKPRYSKVVGETNYKVATQEIWKAGYATDPNYPQLLNSIIEKWDLGRYDVMAMENKDVSPWALEDWNKMKEKGIVQGDKPKEIGTREEAIAFIRRMDKNL